MTIDATDVRDLINNPEGRTPYPEDNKLMLGSAPSGGISDEQLQSILDRLTALEGASDDYSLKVSSFGNKGNDLRVQLCDNNSSTTLGDVLEVTGAFVNKASSPYEYQVPVPVSFYLSNSRLRELPEFDNIPDSNFLKSDGFGFSSGAWSIDWAKTRTPLMCWSGDNHVNELGRSNYDEHNYVVLSAELGANADASTHKLDAMCFFTNLFNEFLNRFVKASLLASNTPIKFSVIDLGGNLMSFSNDIKDKVTRQTVIVNNHESNYSNYITQTLGTTMSGALGWYGIIIEWDKKIIEDDKHTYDKLGVIK